MTTEKISDTYHILTFDNGDVIHLVGTAHVSKNSAEEVREIIEKENPDRVCIELDDGRMKSKTKDASYENMDIKKIFKEGKGFLLLANTALASFQKGWDSRQDPTQELRLSGQLSLQKKKVYQSLSVTGKSRSLSAVPGERVPYGINASFWQPLSPHPSPTRK